MLVGHRGRAQGLFGGRPLRVQDFAFAICAWLAAYASAGWLASRQLPWVAMALLVLTALPGLWSTRRTWHFLYAILIGLMGVGAEWLATAHGAYRYPACPGVSCLGTTVPALWLGPLYLHAAFLVHRLLGGPHIFSARRP
jgi:hypothetical protein